MKKSIERFNEIIREKKLIDVAIAALHWDLETQAPKKGQELLSDVVGYLSSKSYKVVTSDEMVLLIEELDKKKEELTEIEGKTLEEVAKDIEKLMKIPVLEYREYNELTAKGQGIWAEAREKNDFSLFSESLEKIVEFQRRFIKYRGYEGHPYNTILDDYEPGMTVEKLDEFFGYLRKELVPFIKKIKEKGKSVDGTFLKKDFPEDKQMEFSKFIAEYIGFDFERGIISESAHPFTLNYDKNDVRITTRYIRNMLSSSVFGTIHEGGHAIYEQGIGNDIAGGILGEGTSMGIHESQSRFYENILGRSRAFWKPIYRELQDKFEALKDVDIDGFYKGINKSEASLIRVEADELTYSLHIMVRYEIEKALIGGDIEVRELPRVWNEKMKEYLGIEPSNDREGVLQDVHWSAGLMGYFPSYALGNVYASQIHTSMKKDMDVDAALENKELYKIKEWLNQKIHRFGKLKKPEELIMDITGEGLNAKYFVDYLKEKYGNIYGV
ncbi:carboxypeptidase M32 [Ilyobacter polytropus]|uniref:Metal-dependent carboxypeptidase n=1 Tax=Ilyobacter polytropus (strain ATCC 51220 / DSM 2926 / LMG 16218 / CuHBu1) TaxID=572544 RepID=E3H8R1_ILYPC|nr:carboxypeptidase M32 [Ilyobacter polytropus]ADO83325.1 Carboxypeptidase Taq [Ilyobacter polytropus DSM 2926]